MCFHTEMLALMAKNYQTHLEPIWFQRTHLEALFSNKIKSYVKTRKTLGLKIIYVCENLSCFIFNPLPCFIIARVAVMTRGWFHTSLPVMFTRVTPQVATDSALVLIKVHAPSSMV